MPDAGLGQRGADCNLLYGMLALQMNFVSRDALLAAMQAWVFDKARPLGQVLQEQGQLTPERRQAPRRTCSPSTSRPTTATRTRAWRPWRPAAGTLRRRRWAASPTPIPNATLPTVPPPRRAASRYQVLRPHARGGLGEVFVALDQELHREVALKEIQSRFAGDAESRGASCGRRRSRAGWSIPASCRSTAWAPTPTAGRTTPCASSRARRSGTPSPGSTRPRPG